MTAFAALPVIRLTVEGMKHQIVTALSEYEMILSEEIKKAVEAYCRPENIERVVAEQARAVLDEVIRKEVEDFYRHGEGRKAVKEAVLARLGKRGY